MNHYRKAILAGIAAVGTTVIALLDGNLSTEDVLTLVTAWSGVVLVWGIPNDPPA